MNRSELRDDLPEPIRRYFVEVSRIQPPDDLLHSAIADIERSPRVQRFAPLPVLGWAAAAVVIAFLVYTLVLPGLRDIGDPGPSEAPAPSSDASHDLAGVRIGSVTVQHRDPPGWTVRVQTDHRVVGFDDATGDQPGPLSYGRVGSASDRDAHGVVVAELTGVEFHTSDQPPSARNGREFFDNLVALNMGSVSTPSYLVGAVEETELAGWPALTARVEASTGYPLFEGGPDGHLALNLGQTQQLIVADVGGSIVLVQIWANSEAGLASWLPRAEELLVTLTLAPAN